VLPTAARAVCAKAGPPVDEENKRRQQEAAERAERAERVQACFARANVLGKFRDARLADLSLIPEDTRAAYADAVRRLSAVRTTPGFYALIGAIGNGKTRMLNAVVNEFCLEGRSAKYVDAADYIAGVRACWKSPEAGAEERYVQQHLRFSLLAVDEMTMRRGTPDENAILLRLFKKRDDAGVTTAVAGNYESKQEFEEMVDARIADRMCEAGGVIFCNWSSLRGWINPVSDAHSHDGPPSGKQAEVEGNSV
jgi:DNA replication protein DnaC